MSWGSSHGRRLIKTGQKYGYDLVVHVGLSRYLAGLQREEIRGMLRDDHGIELSAGSVSALCDISQALPKAQARFTPVT